MMRRIGRFLILTCVGASLAGCGAVIPQTAGPPVGAPAPRPQPHPVPAPPSTPAPPPGSSAAPTAPTAATSPLTLGPDISILLPTDRDGLARALSAFRTSCPGLMRKSDASGLTNGTDWQPACAAAASWSGDQAGEFFRRYFEPVGIAGGNAFVTGYYEPEIEGCRTPTGDCAVPLYRVPPDLVKVDLGLFSDSLKGKSVRGKVQGDQFIPYDDRAAITTGSLSGRGLELAYAKDAIELFFLEVQGSGRLKLPDGGIMRVGYAGQNGRDYTGIGKLMKDQGLIKAGSMQDIMSWLRSHPDQAASILNANKSYVFFRELTGAGPIGAMGYPVAGRATVAADPDFIPLGGPVLLNLDRTEANGIWIAQDTGGAIKGANRFDTFWGAGPDARRIAGGMLGRGTAWLLLPIGTYARLTAAGNGSTTPQP